ncbi:MAG TPA: TIGR00730 family Rossman fold protein, partial [Thermomonas sp.]|nr:TIGR00730 family Rossman fold protein [Thermomonas sp.]
MKTLCVYCGSNAGSDPAYAALARTLGTRLARDGIALVYGGGNVGLMGIVADAVLAGGGEVVGVIPQQLVDWEVAHQGVTRLEVVDSMHTRKARMFELADGFVALPGGIGTLDELFEIWTWAVLGLHGKPIGMLDGVGYWGPILASLDHMVATGFL